MLPNPSHSVYSTEHKYSNTSLHNLEHAIAARAALDSSILPSQHQHKTCNLEPICEALCRHDYARAIALFSQPASLVLNCACEDAILQAEHALWLASLHALRYDMPSSYHYLNHSQSKLSATVLYQALAWEHYADHKTEQGNDNACQLVEAINQLDFSSDALSSIMARHHAARALSAVGAYTQAVALLEQQDTTLLEPWLLWQHHRLYAYSQQRRGHLVEALEGYQQALESAPPSDKLALRLHIASLWLQYQRPAYALEVVAAPSSNPTSADAVPVCHILESYRHYLSAHAHIRLGNLQEARACLWQAQQHHAQQDIYLLLAQVNYQLGDAWAAVQAYQWAFSQMQLPQPVLTNQAEAMQHAYLWHDMQDFLPLSSAQQQQYAYALALSKTGALEHAEQILRQLITDSTLETTLKGKIYALLAEVSLHQGAWQSSRLYAEWAIECDAVYHGYRILGQMALTRYDLEHAVECFEYAASGVARGSAPWLDINCLLVDTLSRVGIRSLDDAKRIHARSSDILMMMATHAPQHPWRDEIVRQQAHAAKQQTQQRVLN